MIRGDFEYALICWWLTFICKSKLIRLNCSNGALVQLFFILFENCLVLFLPSESYIMKMRCSGFVEVYHTGIHCPQYEIWKVYKYSLKCKNLEVEFNSSSRIIPRNSRSQIDVLQNRCTGNFQKIHCKHLCRSLF